MLFDRRREERYDYPYEIEYALDPFNTDEIFKGIATNINKSGMCLYTSKLLSEGQEITIMSTIPSPSQTATVLWIEKLDNVNYMIGLVFK